MLGEQSLLLSVTQSDFTYTFADHFVYISQLLYSPWGTGYSVVGTGDQLSFQLGLPQLFFIALGLYLVFKKKASQNLIFWLVMLTGVVFFLLPYSSLIWHWLRPLQMVQFPWRLLALTTVIFPFLADRVLNQLKSQKLRRLAYFVILLGLPIAWLYSTPSYLMNPEQFQQQLYIHEEKTTTSSRRELLPKWVTGDERWKGGEEVRILGNNGQARILEANPIRLVVEVETNDTESRVLIRRHYFPSWQLRTETGAVVPLNPDESGEILFTPQAGEHTYTLSLVSTPIAKLGNLLTLLTLAYIIYLAYAQTTKK